MRAGRLVALAAVLLMVFGCVGGGSGGGGGGSSDYSSSFTAFDFQLPGGGILGPSGPDQSPDIAAAPEPSTLALMGSMVGGLLLNVLRKRTRGSGRDSTS
jgi:hypothetical protein